jgi:hypothetical protein
MLLIAGQAVVEEGKEPGDWFECAHFTDIWNRNFLRHVGGAERDLWG